MQNKLHYAVHENTAAEVIYNRVYNEKPFVGMTNFKGNYVTKDDAELVQTIGQLQCGSDSSASGAVCRLLGLE